MSDKRKEQLKNWLKNYENFALVIIVIATLIIRLYYFGLTNGQPLWWDEADYLAYAKNLAGYPVSWIVTAQHNSLYSFLAAILFSSGLGETGIKLLLQLVPSTLSVILVYLIASKMYNDKRIGIAAAFAIGFFWEHLFNSTRFHVDIPALFFGFLAIYIFWTGYEKKEKIFRKINSNYAIPLTVLSLILAYSIRRGYILFAAFPLVYVILTKNWKHLVKDKMNWFSLILGIVLFFLIETTIFSSGIGYVSGTYFHEELPINFLPLKVFGAFFILGGITKSIWFYLFLIGIALMISRLALSYGYIKKPENYETRADLFNVLSIVITLAFFILILRTPDTFGEPRWYFPLLFATLISISKSSIFIADFFKKYHKSLSLAVLVLLLGLGAFYQLNQADDSIRSKLESFGNIRDVSLSLKEKMSEDEIIITKGQPQVEYYSERKTVNPQDWAGADFRNSSLTKEHFEATMKKISETPEAKYMIITFSEHSYPQWMQKIQYDESGRTISWEIPFLDTRINFVTGEQKIEPSATYEDYNLTFTLIDIKQEVFVYRISGN